MKFSSFSALTGPWRFIVPGVALLLLIALIVFGARGCAQDERDEDNRMIEQGIVVERESAHQEVINNVEKARDAVTNPTVNELNVVCEKYDRNC